MGIGPTSSWNAITSGHGGTHGPKNDENIFPLGGSAVKPIGKDNPFLTGKKRGDIEIDSKDDDSEPGKNKGSSGYLGAGTNVPKFPGAGWADTGAGGCTGVKGGCPPGNIGSGSGSFGAAQAGSFAGAGAFSNSHASSSSFASANSGSYAGSGGPGNAFGHANGGSWSSNGPTNGASSGASAYASSSAGSWSGAGPVGVKG